VTGETDTGQGPATPPPAVAAAVPVPEPTPVIPLAASDRNHPPGTAAPAGSTVIGPPDKPELAVGAAFAGGFVLAFILKKITN
jgi:hypothetical protein